MTAFRKYFNLILVTAVFAALLMLFKFGVVEPAYTLKPGNPRRYGILLQTFTDIYRHLRTVVK